MKHVVVWPAARFLVGGKRVVVTKGHQVPAGVDPALLRDLVLAGAIVPASPPSTESSVVREAVDGVPSRPAKSGPVAAWRDYALTLGFSEADLDGLKKPELIEVVTAAEAADPVPADDVAVPGPAEDDSADSNDE